MNQPDNPLAWWDRGQPRKAVAISFIVALALAGLALFPDLNRIYENSSALQKLLSALVALIGLCLAFLEFRHSGEANEHRAEHNRLTEIANKYRDENNKLQREALALQVEVHNLQDSIEKKITKVRLYVRVRIAEPGVRLFLANLSEFDLWINRVRLIVEEPDRLKQESIIGGATRISRGHTEDDYKLYGSLISINSNRTEHLDMKFHVKVEAVGVADSPVIVDSPKYHLIARPGKGIELTVLK